LHILILHLFHDFDNDNNCADICHFYFIDKWSSNQHAVVDDRSQGEREKGWKRRTGQIKTDDSARLDTHCMAGLWTPTNRRLGDWNTTQCPVTRSRTRWITFAVSMTVVGIDACK